MATKKRIKKIPPTEPVITVEDKIIDGIPVKLVTSSYIGDTWTVKCPYCHNTHVVSFSNNAHIHAHGWPMVKQIPFSTDRVEVCCHYFEHKPSLTEDGRNQVTIQWRDLDKKLLTYKTTCPFCNAEILIFVQQYTTKYKKAGRVVDCRATPYCDHIKISMEHDYIFPQHVAGTSFEFIKIEKAREYVKLVEESRE